MEPTQLIEFLRGVALRALEQVEHHLGTPRPSVREVLTGSRVSNELDESAWGFAGGDWLLEVAQCIEASNRLQKNTRQSVAHAFDALKVSAAAVLDCLEFVKDEQSWRLHRRWVEEGNSVARLSVAEAARRQILSDGPVVWRALLAELRPPGG